MNQSQAAWGQKYCDGLIIIIIIIFIHSIHCEKFLACEDKPTSQVIRWTGLGLSYWGLGFGVSRMVS